MPGLSKLVEPAARIAIHLPGEKSRRVGQFIAAANLLAINQRGLRP